MSDYRILYRSIDPAGNLSRETGRLVFSIDRRELPKPQLVIEKLFNGDYVVELSSRDEDAELYYTIGEGERDRYSGPFVVTKAHLRKRGGESIVRAEAQGPQGRKSIPVERRLSVPSLPDTYVSGIEDGKIYSSDISVRPLFTKSEKTVHLRYKLSSVSGSARELPPETEGVNTFSPLFDEEIELTASKGRTLSYRLSITAYDADNNQLRRETTYTVTIDKTAPLPPRFEGIQDGSYYTEIPDVTLSPLSEGQTFLSVSKIPDQLLPAGGELSPEQKSEVDASKFSGYDGEISFDTGSGEIDSYLLMAYTVDAAGNKSRINAMSCTIDRAGVYVAKRGKDSFTGSRERPFRSFERALYETRNSSRRTIFLEGGTYTALEPIDIKNTELSIHGGYSSDTWAMEGRDTVITAATGFPERGELFSIDGGSLTLKGLTLSNSDISSSLLTQRGANARVRMESVKLIHAVGTNPVLLDIESGVFELHSSSVEFGPIDGGEALRIRGGRLSIRESGLVGGSSASSLSILRLKNAQLELIDSEILPGSARELSAIRAENSDISIDNSRVSSGTGEVRAEALRVEGGRLSLENSSIIGEQATRISSGIHATGTAVILSESALDMPARSGIVALSIEGGSLETDGVVLKNGRAEEFSYLLRALSADIVLRNSELVGSFAPDLLALESRGSAVLLDDIYMEIEKSDRDVTLIRAEKGSDIRVNNSSILTRGVSTNETGGTATLLYLDESSGGVIRGSRFAGIHYYLRGADGTLRSSIEDLEMERFPFGDKTPHEGNGDYSVDDLRRNR